MKRRTVAMYTEMGCFVVCVAGWMLVCSTMPTEYWNYSSVDGVVLTTANFFSNLWKDCISDSTGASDCKEFPSLLALDVYIHGCRALVILSIVLGFFGAVLALVGMKCTKIGGSEKANARVTFAAGINFLLSGLSGMTAFSWYGNKIRQEFVDPNFKAQKYEIGAAVFVGWGGSTLLILGGLIYTLFAGKEGCNSSSKHKAKRFLTISKPSRQIYAPSKLPKESRIGRKNTQHFNKDSYV